MFEQAHNVVITGGQFTATNAGERDLKTEGLQILRPKIAQGAFHNSGERYNPPKCYPNTRKVVLDKIMDWVKDSKKLTLFMWIYGPAGTGKSAIAQSIAEICVKSGGFLAASFFFCRTANGRNDESLFVATIVYQLMISVPEVARRIGMALVHDPLLLSRSPEAQIKALIVDPFNEAAMDENDGPLLSTRPNLIIIDGLDECLETRSQRYLLETLLSAAEELVVPLHFLISSRPEPRIRDTFNDPTWNTLSVRIALDDSYQSEEDIRHYLESYFQQIRRRHPSLPSIWPSRSQMQALVQNSAGQFIYVSTVAKYLESDSSTMPQDRLNHLLGLTTPARGGGTPFAEIDAIYHHVLSTVSDIERVSDILILLLMVDFWSKTKSRIEAFFGYRNGEMDLIIHDLHSLIHVPSIEDPDEELRVTHPSTLYDFLSDQSRSKNLFIDPRKANGRLAGVCLSHLRNINSPLMKDPVDVHHLRSLLMVTCVESDLTAQVIVDLYKFNLKQHLAFWNSAENIIGLYESDSKRIVNFISWLRTHDQRHPRYPNDLFAHHQVTIDDWIKEQLHSYTRTRHFNEFLTFGTLTNFLSEEMFSVLQVRKSSTKTFTRSREPDPLQTYACDREFADFYSILAEFLLCEERAKEYFIHGTSFVKLALAILLYLNSEYRESDDAQRQALGIIPKVLSQCSSSAELSRVLIAHKLSREPKAHELFYLQKLVVHQSIKQYLTSQAYNL